MQPSVFISLLFLGAFASSCLLGEEVNSPSKTKHAQIKSTATSTSEKGTASSKSDYQKLLLQSNSAIKESEVPAVNSKDEIHRSQEVLKKPKKRLSIRIPSSDGGDSFTAYEGEDPEGFQRALDKRQEWRVKQLEQEKNRKPLSPPKN
jgi:hypothetical protein